MVDSFLKKDQNFHLIMVDVAIVSKYKLPQPLTLTITFIVGKTSKE